MEGSSDRDNEVLFQRLDLAVDFDGRKLKGKSTMWLRVEREKRSSLSKIPLHCRQCVVKSVVVCGKGTTYEQRDTLMEVVQNGCRDAESFDVNYRSLLRSITEDNDGELLIDLPRDLPPAPDPPAALPDDAPILARARQMRTAQIISDAEIAFSDALASAEIAKHLTEVATAAAARAKEAAAAASLAKQKAAAAASALPKPKDDRASEAPDVVVARPAGSGKALLPPAAFRSREVQRADGGSKDDVSGSEASGDGEAMEVDAEEAPAVHLNAEMPADSNPAAADAAAAAAASPSLQGTSDAGAESPAEAKGSVSAGAEAKAEAKDAAADLSAPQLGGGTKPEQTAPEREGMDVDGSGGDGGQGADIASAKGAEAKPTDEKEPSAAAKGLPLLSINAKVEGVTGATEPTKSAEVEVEKAEGKAEEKAPPTAPAPSGGANNGEQGAEAKPLAAGAAAEAAAQDPAAVATAAAAAAELAKAAEAAAAEHAAKTAASKAAKEAADVASADAAAAEAAAAAAAKRCGAPQARMRLLKVEVTYTLTDPLSGIVFKSDENVSGGVVATHMHTTYTHAPVDLDGARSWFPCYDCPSKQTIFDVHLTLLSSPGITALCSARQLALEEETGGADDLAKAAASARKYRFISELPQNPRALGLAIGPFRVRELSDAPHVRVATLTPVLPPNSDEALKSTAKAVGKRLARQGQHICAHAGCALRFLEKWLDSQYPFQQCTIAFVAGLNSLRTPFGGLILVPMELLAGPEVPESDLPGSARLSLVEAIALGWVAAAVRLRGGTDQWIHNGMGGYLTDLFASADHTEDAAQCKFAAADFGEEAGRFRLWRRMKRVVEADAELSCPSMHPPHPDHYILDALEPAQMEFVRHKATAVMHAIQARVTLENLQTVLRLFLKGPANAKEMAAAQLEGNLGDEQLIPLQSGPQLRRQRSAEIAAERAVFEAEGRDLDGAGSVVSEGMAPLHTSQFLEVARATAAAWGREMARDLTDGFNELYVSGQGVACFVAGYQYNKGRKTVDVVLEQCVTPWWRNTFYGPLQAEVREANGKYMHIKQIAPAAPPRSAKDTGVRVDWQLPTHSKGRVKKQAPRGKKKGDKGGAGAGEGSLREEGAANDTAGLGNNIGNGNNGEGGGSGQKPKKKGKAKAKDVAQASPPQPMLMDLDESNTGDDGGAAAAAAAAVFDEPQALLEAQRLNPSPVLWAKVDPAMAWIRDIAMRKPLPHWVEQLFADTCAAAQADALVALSELPLPVPVEHATTLLPCRAISQCLRGRVSHTQEEHAACIRAEAAICLAMWQNFRSPRTTAVAADVGDAWHGLNLLFKAFGERFEDPEAAAVEGGVALLPNWFDDPAEYAVQKALVWAIANVRAQSGCSPPEVCAFLTRLLRDNDNSENSANDTNQPPETAEPYSGSPSATGVNSGAHNPAQASSALRADDLPAGALRAGVRPLRSYVDDYYIAGVLVALGQVATAQEAGLSENTLAAALFQAQRWLQWGCLRASQTSVVAAAALHCLCELEMLVGGVPATPHARYASPRFPLEVRVVAVQNVVRHCLARDMAAEVVRDANLAAAAGGAFYPNGNPASFGGHPDVIMGVDEDISYATAVARAKAVAAEARVAADASDACEGLSCAVRWVIQFVRNEKDERAREAAVSVLLDCLERRPPRAAFRARFASDDPLDGSCDPWSSREFFRPRGPGKVVYRPDRPLPQDFPGAADAAEVMWRLMCEGTAYNQPLRTLLLQLYRNFWGNATPPALALVAAPKPRAWRGELANVVSTVRPWVVLRSKRRDWIDRNWQSWRRQVQRGEPWPITGETVEAVDDYGVAIEKQTDENNECTQEAANRSELQAGERNIVRVRLPAGIVTVAAKLEPRAV